MADDSIPIPVPAAPLDRRQEALLRNPQFLLAVLITAGMFAMWWTVTFKAIPSENHDIIISLLSAVTTGWVATVGYFFGSNSASKTKDTAIATLAAKPPGGP